MDSHLLKLSTFLIWVGAFVFGISAFSLQSQQLQLYLKSKPQAEILKEMSEEWLASAKMNKRIAVTEISLNKQENKIASVEIQLATHEIYDKLYNEKLIQFLSHKALSETGIAHTYEIVRY